MAPSLHHTIGQGLQAKQIGPEPSKAFLNDLKSLGRYERPFKLFWAFCMVKGLNATSSSITEIASMLITFEKVMPTQERHAYAALLLIPGLDQLAFCPLIKTLKRKWNTSQARYVSFYDAKMPILKLANQTLDWKRGTTSHKADFSLAVFHALS